MTELTMRTCNAIPSMPQCGSDYVYADIAHLICPECAYEWNPDERDAQHDVIVKDANGTVLSAGDKVTVTKDLKVKDSLQVLKIGTKAVVKRMTDGKDHQLDYKVAGVGEMMITAHFVKKA